MREYLFSLGFGFSLFSFILDERKKEKKKKTLFFVLVRANQRDNSHKNFKKVKQTNKNKTEVGFDPVTLQSMH